MIKTVNGLKINYEEKGEGDLIVLLHGWGSNITLFANMIELLSKKYKVVAMDMPGFGKSDEPKEVWDVSSYVQFVIDFLKDYDTKEVMLLGHSFGGRVIIKMHSRDDLPFKVTKVILVDSAGIMPPKSNKKSWRTRYYKLGRTVLSWGIVKKFFPDALENFVLSFYSYCASLTESGVIVVGADVLAVTPAALALFALCLCNLECGLDACLLHLNSRNDQDILELVSQ